MKSQEALGGDSAGRRARPGISVALCTWNGSAFLREQLESIAAQSLSPHELVIFDDCSSDDTVSLARQFAESAPFPVRVHVNPHNLGTRENFAAAVAACTGEIIALADQDDVWLPHKLERLAGALADNLDAAFAFSDALMVDEQLQPIPYTLWKATRFSRAELRQFQRRRGFEVLLRRDVVTGATLAFRASYRDLLLPIPPGWVHDAWIALILSGVSWGVPVAEPLIQYRQHARQQIGERRRNLYQQFQVARRLSADDYRRVTDANRAALERVEQLMIAAPATQLLREKVQHLDRRAHIHASSAWRWPQVLGEWWCGNYARYSRGWKALAQDLFL
jgi:glycosyltransferase involved in cell wall biosynthesis